MSKITITTFFIFMWMLSSSQHPSLTLTPQGVEMIKKGLGSTELFDKEFKRTKEEINLEIEKGFDVPIPKDMAGGYTHEVHKRNYKFMLKSAKLYQFTKEDKYAKYVKDMLLEYAAMYPTLPIHPTKKSYATGKIFWQCLNDANWLVFTSQSYDCIYDYLSEAERKTLEEDLFIPFANFLSIENPRFFNRVHNHSTWANSAVGLIALAMDNDSLLQKALYGLPSDNINPDELDNDGGFIKKENESAAGFFAQLDYSFTPEGYFTEGPYYQRYAIFPFLVFSHALDNKKPELKIFEYRNSILKKATNAMLQLTDVNGHFFPINDSQKGMSFKAFEIVTAIDLMYKIDPTQKQLLTWAKHQNKVSFDEAGYFVANALENFGLNPIKKESQFFGDGVNGDEGGVAVLRIDETDLLFKFSTHGMGHGHYDRLSYSLYDKSGEVVQDYGAVRWVNVDQKAGGRYLPENKTFGKQTITHNTLVVNQKSQFNGKIKDAEKVSPELYFSDFSKQNLKIVSAIENNAYENIAQQRTLMLYKDESFSAPLVIDLFQINSSIKATYDLPLWYNGHFMKSSTTCPKDLKTLKELGVSDGYQHIWQESECIVEDENIKFNWFGNNRFYTLTGISNSSDKLLMGRAGANDPNYNLRSDPVFIHRKETSGKVLYFNILESHGKYDRSTEIPLTPYSNIEELKVIHMDDNYIICSFANNEYRWEIYYSYVDKNPQKTHKIKVADEEYSWQGTHKINKIKLN